MNNLTVTYKGGLEFEAVSGGHKISIDLPKEKGGEDKAMSPPQILAAALASCVGVYVIFYCRIAKIDASGCSIKVEWQLADDKRSVSAYEIKIHLPKAELGERAQAVLEAARNCLVHKTFQSSPNIDISLASS